MPRKISKDNDGKPYANVLLQGEIVQRCMEVREKTGVPITSIARMAILDWLAKHNGEAGIERVSL